MSFASAAALSIKKRRHNEGLMTSNYYQLHKNKNMTKEERIETILNQYGQEIKAQIKKGFTGGSILGYFKWQATENGFEIELLN